MERPIRLDPAVWDALHRIAAEEDVTIGQIIREAITRDLRRRAEAKTPVRADERLVAPLRALLADDFAFAAGWGDLQSRLARKGYRLAEAGGGLVLQAVDSGERLCKASELGYSYSALLRRFDCVFPGHAHTAPLRRIRGH
jgi:hypothetical protein